MSAYRAHVQLTKQELDRLTGAILLRQLYLAAWYYWRSVTTDYQPVGTEGWWPDFELTGDIATKAVTQLAKRAT